MKHKHVSNTYSDYKKFTSVHINNFKASCLLDLLISPENTLRIGVGRQFLIYNNLASLLSQKSFCLLHLLSLLVSSAIRSRFTGDLPVGHDCEMANHYANQGDRHTGDRSNENRQYHEFEYVLEDGMMTMVMVVATMTMRTTVVFLGSALMVLYLRRATSGTSGLRETR